MGDLRQYIISVTAAAVICSILNSLAEKTAAKTVITLLCGLFMTFAILAPVVNLDPESMIRGFMQAADTTGEETAAIGESLASDAIAQIIKEKTCTYILDKAAACNVHLEVELLLSEGSPPVPEGVILRGKISPYTRIKLQKILEDELGISKENQQWMG